MNCMLREAFYVEKKTFDYLMSVVDVLMCLLPYGVLFYLLFILYAITKVDLSDNSVIRLWYNFVFVYVCV